MKRYLIVFERTETGYSAYSPDLPGCISTGRTRAEVEANMREAIVFHIEGLQLEGRPVPDPQSEYGYVDVAAQNGWLPADRSATLRMSERAGG